MALSLLPRQGMDSNPVASAMRDVLTGIRQRKRVDEILEMVLNFSGQLGNALHGSIVTVDHHNKQLIIASTQGKDWTLEKQTCQLKIGQGLTGRVAETGKPYLCNNTRQDPHYFPLFDNVQSELVVPIVVEEKVWGLINLDGLEVNAFDDATVATVMLLAELASFAIKLRLDLNEQERLQRHLVQAEKLASLGETIAGIAHEINNPLTSILSHASLLSLRRGGVADETSINAIVQESRRTADLVKNLLAFSRKETAKRDVVGINELIKQALNLKRYQLRVNNIQLIFEPSEVSFPVMVSAQQMQQVMLNLINNAEQAIGQKIPQGTIRVEAGRSDDNVFISVSDNGQGIPPDVMPYIFDPFFSTKGLGEGTGLGLSIAHTLVENHGGQISARSEFGKTVFLIRLPLARSPEGVVSVRLTEKLPPPSPRRTKQRGRVLVVDDEVPIVDALCEFLNLQNIATDRAGDGDEAMVLLRQKRYDAVISDIRMPGADGPQLYERATFLDAAYRHRFLFMSGDLVRESTQTFVSSISCACLSKPFSLDVLYRHLLPHLDQFSSLGSPEVSHVSLPKLPTDSGRTKL